MADTDRAGSAGAADQAIVVERTEFQSDREQTRSDDGPEHGRGVYRANEAAR